MRSFPTEYYILADFSDDGPVIGYLAERPIADRIRDGHGRRYHYAGLVPKHLDGTFDLKALGPGEWIVEPGLVYALDDAPIAKHPWPTRRQAA